MAQQNLTEISCPDDDLEHYCKIVTALQETIRLLAAINAAIPHWSLE